jgi:hypothetical protein
MHIAGVYLIAGPEVTTHFAGVYFRAGHEVIDPPQVKLTYLLKVKSMFGKGKRNFISTSRTR